MPATWVRVPEISKPTEECPHPEMWQMADGDTAEIEVLEFLHAITRALKPGLVVETGSFKGYSAVAIGTALRLNTYGSLWTIECDEERYRQTLSLIAATELSDFVTAIHNNSMNVIVQRDIDLLFCDSDPGVRVNEILRFWDALSPRSVILVHDVNTGIHRNLREHLQKFAAAMKLSVVLLPTPRGLAICQKTA
jgi:predicted O-methyltransferase YrrM